MKEQLLIENMNQSIAERWFCFTSTMESQGNVTPLIMTTLLFILLVIVVVMAAAIAYCSSGRNYTVSSLIEAMVVSNNGNAGTMAALALAHFVQDPLCLLSLSVQPCMSNNVVTFVNAFLCSISSHELQRRSTANLKQTPYCFVQCV